KFSRGICIIPAACEIIAVGVQSTPETACAGWRRWQEEIGVAGVSQIGFIEKSQAFIQSHPKIERSAKGGHLSFDAEKNLLAGRLRDAYGPLWFLGAWLERFLTSAFAVFRATRFLGVRVAGC